jgi:hypothetical protein
MMTPKVGVLAGGKALKTKPAPSTAPAVSRPPKGQPRLRTHGILVLVHPEFVRVNCEVLRVRRGESIQWVPDRGSRDFDIEFKADTGNPFSTNNLILNANRSGPHLTIRRGVFRYTVIDRANPWNRLDPEVIVDPPMP